MEYSMRSKLTTASVIVMIVYSVVQYTAAAALAAHIAHPTAMHGTTSLRAVGLSCSGSAKARILASIDTTLSAFSTAMPVM